LRTRTKRKKTKRISRSDSFLSLRASLGARPFSISERYGIAKMRKELYFLSARMFPATALALLILLSGLAAASCLSAAPSPPQFEGWKKGADDKNAPKNLVGQVVDKEGKGMPEAIVHLKDKRTLAVKTHISDERGNYRFPGLDPNTDYEVHAESKGASSPKRSVSSFDSRKEIYLVLEIDAPQ
jgi:hypothetical protein